MKKMKMILLVTVCMLYLAACGSKAPSLKEVEQAIQEGSVTIEDALEKGWVTQEWVDSYMENRSVPAADKAASNAVASFTTTTVSGEEFTSDRIPDVTFFAFIDPADEGAGAYYQGLVAAHEGVLANGGQILLCTKDKENTEMFSDAPFPVILYNASLKEAVKNNAEMIEGIPNTGSWYINGAFLSAWTSSVDTEDIVESAKAFTEIQQETNGEENNGDMAVIG